MQTITIPQAFVITALEGAVKAGLDAEDLLQRAGISRQLLSNKQLRIPAESFTRLVTHIVARTGDEAFALLATPQPLGSFRLLAQCCFSNNTIDESLRTVALFSNIQRASVTAQFSRTDQLGKLSVHCQRGTTVKGTFIIEVLLATIHRLQCWLAKDFLPLARVELAYPAPPHMLDYRFLFYGAPVVFDAPESALFFHQSSLDAHIRREVTDLDTLLAQPFHRLITQPKNRHTQSAAIRQWLEDCIRHGAEDLSLAKCAQQFAVTAQTIRRRLMREGIAFQQLKDETRRDLAVHYITAGELSVEAIALTLGFSEASTFIRAFKLWTGVTPLAFRKL